MPTGRGTLQGTPPPYVTTEHVHTLRDVSPLWARRGSWNLYLYFSETHQEPHVAVRGSGHRASIRIADGAVLAGHLPAQMLREVRNLLQQHADLATEAFRATAAYEFPGTLEEMLRRAGAPPHATEVDDYER